MAQKVNKAPFLWWSCDHHNRVI